MLRIVLTGAFACALAQPAGAIVGAGAEAVLNSGPGRHVVMIISTRGSVCTGTAVARDVVLTAAHCVAPAASYRVSTPDKPEGHPTRRIVVHPNYSAQHYAAGRVTADVALIKLEDALPGVVPVAVSARGNVAAGDRFTVAGFGTIRASGNEGLGVPRAAVLVATGRPGNLQVRLVDAATKDKRPGLGACTGDSGGPAFRVVDGRYHLFGVVSWSTGPNGSAGCGGLTGLTPLTLHERWIGETLRQLRGG